MLMNLLCFAFVYRGMLRLLLAAAWQPAGSAGRMALGRARAAMFQASGLAAHRVVRGSGRNALKSTLHRHARHRKLRTPPFRPDLIRASDAAAGEAEHPFSTAG